MYPIKFEPIYKERIWGGSAFSQFGRTIDETKNIGESWEITDHENGISIIANGEFKGLTLKDLIGLYPQKILGDIIKCKNIDRFPLLVKFIDANQILSVQIHPDDQYAYNNENGEFGKTEMWYIVEAKPKAKLIIGLKENITKEEFLKAVGEGRIEETLNEVVVKKGDVIFIPAGTVHAIGEGLLICEIQQNSDITYRLFDWNRVDDKGQERELHINKAIEVINLNNEIDSIIEYTPINYDGYSSALLVQCEYFTVELLEIKEEVAGLNTSNGFNIITVLGGSGKIIYCGDKEEEFKPGETILIPAALNQYKIVGQCQLLRTY